MIEESTANGLAPLPRSVRAAAAVLLLHATWVLLNAAVWQTLSGWEDWRAFPRALVRAGMLALLAWGLSERERWAWWIAVLFSGAWTVIGVAGLLGALHLGNGTLSLQWSERLSLTAGVASLAAAFVLLLLPSTRAAIRRRGT